MGIQLVLSLVFLVLTPVLSFTDPGDVDILNQFKKNLEIPELLQWPENGDPCGPPSWKRVFCANSRVTQIQVQSVRLKGPLPQNLNQLSKLENLGLQKNQFNGKLPNFSGLSSLKYAYLDNNEFDSIPGDFFDGLVSLESLALDDNNFNATTGWSFPEGLKDSVQLSNLSCMNCNLVGHLPDFLGGLSSLQNLKLSGNSLSGEIPASFKDLNLVNLWLNDQQGGGLSGPIDVVANIVSLQTLWLHGNQFIGKIPENIGNLTALKDLNLNSNKLVGLIPPSLASMPLDNLDLNNNMLMGPIAKFGANKSSFNSNSFCLPTPGPCALEVVALIEILDGLNYPQRLVASWSGNNPCTRFGLGCDHNNKFNVLNLPGSNLSGTLSPSVAKLDSLTQIRLQSKNLRGAIPMNWTSLKYLALLDLSGNNISPRLPKFSDSVHQVIEGNPLLNMNQSRTVPRGSPFRSSGLSDNSSAPTKGSNFGAASSSAEPTKPKGSKRAVLVAIVAPVVSVAVVVLLAVPLYIYCRKNRKDTLQAPSSLVIYPRDPSDSDNKVRIVVANGSTSTVTGSGPACINFSGIGDSHVIEAGNLVISVQVLRNVTKNFASENELGCGGFRVVYKGELDDGTKIAMKRMEAGVISGKALDEFQAEIAVLSEVRHRHLVSLLGYSIESYDRILVYEYMAQGALSKHLFHWKSLNLEPLSWKRRLNIALDVARGMEYLHTLAHQSFIHRDLKFSNILLGDDFRAKVSDFGLVKLAPDGEKSVVTRLAGTFGCLAPDYAVTGTITTKTDVFSFGVVLMELLMGLMALDEDRPEESQYLAAWFWIIKSDKEKLRAVIDRALDVKDETFESICTIVELTGHCTTREPSQRPDMGHPVNILAPPVEKWKPLYDDPEDYCGIDYSLPLNQMVKDWQEAEGKDISYMDLEDG
ncbi:receptor-like kinase TMK3 [Mangifera indica]|uniref:receptor-like kinase TMK3 n=1 Tax=Mangifera indica TaxID=29780 RepID=UPI001CF9FFA9|nr:receptor-like kinase TMK3 [Mangifera indica]